MRKPKSCACTILFGTCWRRLQVLNPKLPQLRKEAGTSSPSAWTHPRHLQSPTTHPELLRLLWDKGTWPPEAESRILAFLCCWGQRWRGTHVTVAPASPGEPGRPMEGRIASGLASPLGCFLKAKQGDLSCGGVSSWGCSSCRVFVPVPPPAHSPAHGRRGELGRGDGEGWFVFPLLCLKIPPPAVPCETGLSPGPAGSGLPHPGNAPA